MDRHLAQSGICTVHVWLTQTMVNQMCPFQGDVSDFTKRVRSNSLVLAFSIGNSLKPYYLIDFTVTILTCYQKDSMKWLDLSQWGCRQCPVALDGSPEKEQFLIWCYLVTCL